MNRNTLGFVVSIGLLFFAYMGINHYYMTKQLTTSSQQSNLSQTTAMPPSASTSAPTAVTPAAATTTINPNQPTAVVPPTPVAQPTPATSELLAYENDVLRLQFEQTGGCLGTTFLKNYHQAIDVNEAAMLNENYSLCKLFGTKLNGNDQRAQLMYADKPAPNNFEFRTPAQDDLEVVKSFDFSPGNYRATLSVTVKNLSTSQNKNGQLELEIGATSDAKSQGWLKQQLIGHEFLEFSDDKVHRTHLPFHDAPKREVLVEKKQAVPAWVGTSSLYFLTALLPKQSSPIDLTVLQTGYNIQRNQSAPTDRSVYEAWLGHAFQLQPGASQTWQYDVYAGPKIKEQLDVFEGKKLSQAIDYGFFEIVAWPIFYALNAIHKVVGNWGFAIIILTIAIKLLMYPLTRMAYVAGKKMQKVQPQLAAIREKYKDDKMKQNQETMALMSQTGTNPLSGCLPILPTIPVFFALFSVLQHSFELRHAPFLFWIRDLSTMDPLFITPVALALSYYTQQRLTPMPTVDPAQAKMMQFLPLIFAVFMLTFPSGLVIYSLVNSIMTMLQQQYMMRKYKDL